MGDIDVGHGFYYRTFTEDGADGPTGLILYGPAGPECPYKGTLGEDDPTICGGGINFENSRIAEREGRPRWKVEQTDPLTVSPSILCKCRGQHGFIRNGRYEPC